MEKVLLVEDAVFFGSIIERRLRHDMGLEPVWVQSMAEAEQALEDHPHFTLALLDLTLPDADGAEIVELVREFDIPTIVFSGTYDRHIRDAVMALGVIDYVIKESPASMNYLFATVSRVLLNRTRTVLVVEDSAPIRHMLVEVLQRFQLQVIAVNDGEQALATFHAHPEIALVITDYEMPAMNGLELTKAIHREALERKFAVIGLSSVTDTDIRIQFIKSGADDFLTKPFEIEELFCRISQNLNFLDQLELLHQQANNDFLTGLYNRRYFFETGASKLAQADRSGELCAVALLDIDNFKAINDTYGHDAGDRVLIDVAERLQAATRSADVLARLGGEEFCKLLIAPSVASLGKIAMDILTAIGESPFSAPNAEIAATVSIGIAWGEKCGLPALLDAADQSLYQAKNSGRNRAVIAPTDGSRAPFAVEGPPDIKKPYLTRPTTQVQDWR